jgi:hypothetical protein
VQIERLLRKEMESGPWHTPYRTMRLGMIPGVTGATGERAISAGAFYLPCLLFLDARVTRANAALDTITKSEFV